MTIHTFLGHQAKKRVMVSVASMLQNFHACSMEYILTTCKGKCCSSNGGRYMITVLDEEVAAMEALGVKVEKGFMVIPEGSRCIFHGEDGLCGINNDKPFGCRVSPFSLTSRDVLIVRNRFRMMGCFKQAGEKIPVYKAHPFALTTIFGAEGYAELVRKLEPRCEGKFIPLLVEDAVYKKLKANDAHKKLMSTRDI